MNNHKKNLPSGVNLGAVGSNGINFGGVANAGIAVGLNELVKSALGTNNYSLNKKLDVIIENQKTLTRNLASIKMKLGIV